ncbi:hypothetical protein ACFFX0_01475 [Citricoccus parietis]|uniref:Uncharacterized protein n=1 Tax=Citricoccus parietis TaxID=592307 RepID=A0ABV5FTC3_9MICC
MVRIRAGDMGGVPGRSHDVHIPSAAAESLREGGPPSLGRGAFRKVGVRDQLDTHGSGPRAGLRPRCGGRRRTHRCRAGGGIRGGFGCRV